jgi:L-fuconate dehydratase
MRRGRYTAPTRPGYSSEIKPESRDAYRYPDGPVWTRLRTGAGERKMSDA